MITTTVTTPGALLTAVSPTTTSTKKWCEGKISVIGAGSVGTAIAFALLTTRLCSHLAIIDKNEELARGEMLDMQNATMFLSNPEITSSSEYGEAGSSRICIITAGSRSSENKKETAVRQNTEIYKEIIPALVSQSPGCILIICSFPVDEMSYVAWKLSGFEPHRIIGSGCILESSRFRSLIARKLDVCASCCQAYVIGEYGSHSIPVWSSVSIAGVRLRDVNPDLGTPEDPEDWGYIHKEVIARSDEVTCLKEAGSWGVALGVASIVKAIMNDTQECYSVSTHLRGCRHGIDKDVFMSLPCVINSTGIKFIVRQSLNEAEKELLQKSADRMYEIQKTLGLESNETMADC